MMANWFESLKAAFSSRYTIERELGNGGMATVYLAHDTVSGSSTHVLLHP